MVEEKYCSWFCKYGPSMRRRSLLNVYVRIAIRESVQRIMTFAVHVLGQTIWKSVQ